MPEYIKLLNLVKHIEGGYFGNFYKSNDQVLPLNLRYKNYTNEENHDIEIKRSAGSSIYFLLEQNDFSAWHRLKSDEIWHYYDGGSPIDIYVIDHNGELKIYPLGNPGITENASFQVVIKAGYWFAAEVRDKSSFALAGCTVSPGFEYDDFELAQKHQLFSKYPQHENILIKFLHKKYSINKSWAQHALKIATIAFISGTGFYFSQKDILNIQLTADDNSSSIKNIQNPKSN